MTPEQYTELKEIEKTMYTQSLRLHHMGLWVASDTVLAVRARLVTELEYYEDEKEHNDAQAALDVYWDNRMEDGRDNERF